MEFDQLAAFLEDLNCIDDRETAFEKLKDENFIKNLIKFINCEEIDFAAISDKHYDGLIYLLPLTTKVLKNLIKLDKFSYEDKEKIIATANKSLISSVDSIIDLDLHDSLSDNFLDKLKEYKEKISGGLLYSKEELEGDIEKIHVRKKLREDIQQSVEISEKLSQIDKLLKDIDYLIEGLKNGN